MNHKLQTCIMVRVGESAEVEWNATVIYHRHKGFDGGSHAESPPEPAYCEIVDILVREPGRDPFKLHPRFCEALHDGLQGDLMADWADDEEEADVRRGEQARDDRMMERF